MSDPIDLDAFRAKRPGYINKGRINSLCDLLEEEAARIVTGSVEQCEAPDPVAAELLAHVNAIRRIFPMETT